MKKSILKHVPGTALHDGIINAFHYSNITKGRLSFRKIVSYCSEKERLLSRQHLNMVKFWAKHAYKKVLFLRYNKNYVGKKWKCSSATYQDLWRINRDNNSRQLNIHTAENDVHIKLCCFKIN